MTYWIIIDDRQLGPLTVDEIAATGRLRHSTPVWYNGLAEWTTADNVPELASLLVPPSAPTPPSEVPATPTIETASEWVQAKPRPVRAEPRSYLLWAILATVVCCLPIGIGAIYMSTRVSSRYSVGDYSGAHRASQATELWLIATVVGGLVSLPFQVALAMMSA
jgi:hypothetical protein